MCGIVGIWGIGVSKGARRAGGEETDAIDFFFCRLRIPSLGILSKVILFESSIHKMRALENFAGELLREFDEMPTLMDVSAKFDFTERQCPFSVITHIAESIAC